MVFDIFTLVEGLWLFLPAYAANGLAPLVKFKKNLHPIDSNKKLFGRPIFGQGKTWEGLFLGVLVATVIAAVEMLAFPYLPWGLSEEIHGIELSIVPMSILLGLMIGSGAMFGDIAASFLKRRIGLERGKAFPVLDQDDFVLGSFLLASLIVPAKISWLILFLVITPIFHLIANLIAFRLKVKKEPW